MKRILYIVFAGLLLVLSWNCNLLIYGVRQGIGQAKILWKSVPVEKVVKDSQIPDSVKQKLVLIQEIKKYTEDSLGFKPTKNYTTFYDQQNKPLLWVVTACPHFSLEEYKWKFPFVGNVGYIGFFKKELAVKEAAKLRKKQYDVAIDEVNAWSTLGWFKDPVLSSMLSKPEGELCNLVIHELTHTTVYFKGNNDLSENLATFVGHQGTLRFLSYKYGKKSHEYNTYLQKHNDVTKISLHILRGANRLDSLYKSEWFQKADSLQKQQLKRNLIKEVISQIDTLQLYHPESFYNLQSKADSINNAFFAGFKMYRAAQPQIDSIFRNHCGSNIKKLIEYYQNNYGE
ncbi:MAG: aminopeptidase [Bacteroidetes bacterium]|nr:MAG: aminopeptidase [Bacteroidota bacterium]